MPQIELVTSSGALNFNYTISTPTSSSSTTIDRKLPCILFIHAEYISQEIFEAQFSDPLLRKRFNLIAVDLRGCGHTTTLAKEDYTPIVAADDIYQFMDALKIPIIHVFGISIGCHIALEFALAHPNHVASLMLCTIPSIQEPPEVLAGRQEVYDFWNDSGEHEGGSTTVSSDLDDDLVTNLVRGIQLMLFGESSDPLLMPLIGYATTLAKFVWAGSPEALTSAHVVLVEWFSKRRVFDVATLSKIKCPVSIIRFEEDIAYQLHDSEEFVALLRDANVKVDFHQVSGPHFGHVTHSDLVNPILCEHVLSVAVPNAPLPMAELNGQRKERLDSPFKKDLMKFGFRADELDTDSSADA